MPNDQNNDLPFWQRKPLKRLTRSEWESLCDGCARCCLVKYEDAETGKVMYTDVACYLLDLDTCLCGDYANRSRLVPTCLWLTPRLVKELDWIPPTCAYRLLAEGKPLEWWHPLVSGDPDTVHRAGISVRHRVFSEKDIPENELEDHIQGDSS